MSHSANRAARYYLGDPCYYCGKTNTFIEIDNSRVGGGCYLCGRPFIPKDNQVQKAKEGAATWHF